MMRSMNRKRLITRLTFVLVTLARPTMSQEVPAPTPTFPARVEQVTVDVVVVDGKGQPVTDLTRESLEVYEDGARQTIASFDLFQVAATANAAPASGPVPPHRGSRRTRPSRTSAGAPS